LKRKDPEVLRVAAVIHLLSDANQLWLPVFKRLEATSSRKCFPTVFVSKPHSPAQ
jgi:hypothetical protein